MLLSLMVAAVDDLPMKSRFLVLDDKNYMLQNPEFVASGAVNATWSPDGTQLVVICEDPRRQPLDPAKARRQTKLVFWSATARKVIGTFAVPTTSRFDTVEWEGLSGSVIMSLGRDEDWGVSVNRVNVNGSATTLVPQALGMSTSQTEKGVLFMLQEGADQTLYYAPAGKAALKLTPPPSKAPWSLWQGGFRVEVMEKTVVFYTYDPRSNSFTKGGRSELAEVPSRRGEGMSRLAPLKVQFNLDSLWLMGDEKSKFPAALLAPSAKVGAYSEKAPAAWYIDSGNAFVRNLKAVTKDELDDALECEEMQRLVMECKQVGTSLQIYLSDNDDRFPPVDKFRESIMPYLRNEALFQGFITTYKSGIRAEDIKDNAKEVIGYKDGAYGRAVTYADTHTVWESRRKRQIGCEE